ncbi:MAG: undecaprenyl diphosphate synthase family protein [Lachnospiraceae bacterium]|nr:undecaprenyl diphosphate synthase family protein [Lachnospiraceae bacterium]
MRIPNHIAIIPDGNRRYAVSNGMEKKEGYGHGLKPGLLALRKAKELGVKEITFYGFTVDNCKRPSEQVAAFQKACVKAVELLQQEGAELLVMGNEESKCFPEALKKYRRRQTICGGGIRLNFLVNYGWDWDLSHVKVDGRPWSCDISRIDMVIRWGGRYRLSGLLPIQSVYADIYSIPHMWPEYSDEDIEGAFAWYNTQDVTLGG